ncbi:UDP-N-acetylglucosamine transferase subunit ALG14 [Thermococcus aggregans]|uniref:UDP-N-acetylglucosamine transferase subunit ALG14 n=1 Tax=Thermococcus aggregans TaxID=110163 RepID=A0A9E7MY64_THEAG|nr:PssD/Cps14F family polysaccharide biosynthesis glycosyltransferase [Thermococcus aggregans]USS41058.1 UDP-N-acetylglucosamine transferase subunit ALG14 [Thermococcus aggregans]
MKLLAACESGGHLTQMTYILKHLRELREDINIVLVTEDSKRTKNLKSYSLFDEVYLLETSGYKNKYLRYLHAFSPTVFIKVLRILKKERPDVIISTAGWVSIPAFILSKVVFGIPTIYIHSWSRVTKKSDSGRILYYFSDVFIVQWPQLLEKYGKKARYFGGIL